MATITQVMTWVQTLNAGTAVQGGNSLTVTVNVTAGWEVQIPMQSTYGTASLGTGVYVYPTMDGGANYDTDPIYAFAMEKTHETTHRQSIRLTTGQYAIEMRASSPTVTCAVVTFVVITAVDST